MIAIVIAVAATGMIAESGSGEAEGEEEETVAEMAAGVEEGDEDILATRLQ